MESLASIFADPGDLRRYREAIANGATEQEALRVGDSGVGAWGDDTTSMHRPQVAIYGAPQNALVRVTGPKGTVIAMNTDKAPDNGRIDLNPATAAAVGHTGGLMPVTWDFIGEGQPTDVSSTPPAAIPGPAPTPTPSPRPSVGAGAGYRAPVVKAIDPSVYQPTQTDKYIEQARKAIQMGAPVAAVAGRLRGMNIDPHLLFGA